MLSFTLSLTLSLILSSVDVHCGEMYAVYAAQQTVSTSDLYLTQNTISCSKGLRLNDGRTDVAVECMASGFWRDHDFYTDCAGERK